MFNVWIILIILAFIISYASVKYTIKLNILDIPNKRKIHTNPTPKAGGLGIFISAVMLIFIADMFIIDIEINYILFIILSAIMLFVGLYDDINEMRPRFKLGWQIIAAMATVLFGFTLNLTPYVLINAILTVIWIIGFVNAFNLIDGMDGLAIGVFIICMLGYAYLLSGSDWISVIFILLGSGLAFLKYNYKPAEIFLGDTGSLYLGYILAFFAVIYTQNIDVSFSMFVNNIIVIGLILFVPIFDTTLSIIRRKINNRPLFRPDRSHFYNLLEDDLGLSTIQTVNTIYIINIITVLISILIINFNIQIQLVVGAGFVLIVIFTIKKLDFLKIDDTAENI